jgi:hypothetical protein
MKNATPRLTRRSFSELLLGSTGLAALATGLSPLFVRSPLAWAADAGAGGSACNAPSPQFLILSDSGKGDPINANCPGTYEDARVVHPPGDDFAATPMTLGGVKTTAAKVWSTLPAAVLARTAFVHHATRTVVHPDMPKVLSLLGGTKNSEMLPSLLAAELAPCLGTLQSQPLALGSVTLSSGGAVLPTLTPTALRALLLKSASPLVSLRSVRDRHLDALSAIVKKDGTPSQRRYLDERALSRDQARKLADDAASIFSAVTDDGPMSQVTAAVGLVRLKVAPVLSITLPFGGDNHADDGLASEAAQHVDSMATLTQLMTLLDQNGLSDQVTFASMNVFGRTLLRKGTAGRDHWPRHAVSLLIGKRIRAGVVGGLVPYQDDFSSVGIDSASGRGVDGGGDIPYEETLGAVGKTIGAAVGIAPERLADAITAGKPIQAALV